MYPPSPDKWKNATIATFAILGLISVILIAVQESGAKKERQDAATRQEMLQTNLNAVKQHRYSISGGIVDRDPFCQA